MSTSKQLRLLDADVEADLVAGDERATYGEVFTRRWVVDLILNLVGYTTDRDLGRLRIVEPACGRGAFLDVLVGRLVTSAQTHGRPLEDLADAVRAFDLRPANVDLSRKHTVAALEDAGVDLEDASRLAETWVTRADFLLQEHEPGSADFVVGNPPYIRPEDLTPHLLERYRAECPTMRGRADIYAGFFERGLQLLRDDGRLGFICADRWMHNQYGAGLRGLLAEAFSVDTVITMHDVDAFEDEVSAYPAVVIAEASEQGPVCVVEAGGQFDAGSVPALLGWLTDTSVPQEGNGFTGSELSDWFSGSGLWPTGSPGHLAVLREIERNFAPLEDRATGTQVGIGVATGCDDVFITPGEVDIEDDRLLPLLMADDVTEGHVSWKDRHLVNPWDDAGLVDLAHYPKMAHHFEVHCQRLKSRHVARRRPDQWFRTIDRVQPRLLDRPRLVLPDIKARAHPVLDDGPHYPHHNLYHVTSSAWDLEVLGGLLLSDVADLFVGAYCVKMRGGCYRFQAQYLRKIRVPQFQSISPADRRCLAQAFAERDREAATAVATQLYGLEASALRR